MKKVLLFVLLFVLAFCGCSSEGNNSKTAPEEILSAESTEGIRTVRMIYTDGNFYYDTGVPAEVTGGTVERGITRTAQLFCIPEGEASANFYGENLMLRPGTSITKQVYANGEGTVFRKVESYGEDLGRYKFCYTVEGRHPNAKADSKYLVMANERNINFEKITKYFFSSQLEDHMLDAHIVPIGIYDKWGVRMYTINETDEGCTLVFEQLGGNAEGDLQTGDWYKLEKYSDDKWTDAETVITIESVGWNQVAYMIKKNDITEFELNWRWLYGKLPQGTYRISKEVMDFKGTGNFEEEIYSYQFVIE